MSSKDQASFHYISAINLDLRIGFDIALPSVKTYDLVPDLGVIRGFGTNKTDRKALVDVLHRLDYQERDCVYLLLRQMSVNYVGMTQNIQRRLDEHSSQRKGEKNWDRVLVFYLVKPIHNTSLAAFIERTLYLRLTERGFLLYQDPPDGRALNPDDQKVAQRFVTEVERIIELLDMAQPSARTRQKALEVKDEDVQAEVQVLEELRASRQQSIEVELSSQGANAFGKYTGFGLEVFAGSVGNSRIQPHLQHDQSFLKARQELEETGVIEINGEQLKFVKNYIFSSPTAAARILTGSSVPGPLRWKTVSEGIPLRDI